MAWTDAVYDWLVRGCLVTMPLLVIAAALVTVCRQPARRIWLIELTLIACLVAPWVALLPGLPHWSVMAMFERSETAPVVQREAATRERIATQPSETRASAFRPSEELRSASFESAPVERIAAAADDTTLRNTDSAQPNRPRFTLRQAIVLAYLAGVVGMISWWIMGVVGLLRVLHTGETASANGRQVLHEVAGNAASRVTLLVSSRIEQPFTFTWRRAVILLPRSLCDQPDLQPLRWALAHEWAHVRNCDALTWALAGVVRMVFCYQPLVWWLRRRLRVEQDYLADALAAGHAPSPEDYAEFLTTWVSAHSRRPAAIGLGIGGRTSDLYRRVVMLVEPRLVLEARTPAAWRLGAVASLLVIVAAAATCGETPRAPKINATITNASTKQSASSDDSGERSDDAETRKLVDAALARATAIKSGVLEFRETFDVPNGTQNKAQETSQWRCCFSGESWTIGIPPRVHVVNHDGRCMRLVLNGAEPVGYSSRRALLTIEAPGTWTQKQMHFPIHAGTIASDATIRFLRQHADRARRVGGAKVNEIDTEKLEWTIGPKELNAFGPVNQMLQTGGTLRLYVARQLAGVLPRIEHIDRFGTVQNFFNASDFREVARGIYFAFHCDEASGQRIDFLKVEQINEKLPVAEFVIAPIPAWTQVIDERPKSTDKVDSTGQRTVDLARYPYRQFTTGAEYPDGLPAALLAEMDRDVIRTNQRLATALGDDSESQPKATASSDQDQWRPPKDQLRYAGRTFEEWRWQLHSDLEPKMQVQAIEALQAFGAKGYAEEAVAAIAPALGNKDNSVRGSAFTALSKIGSKSLPVLVEALRSDDPGVRQTAAWSLGEIAPADQTTIDALTEATRGQDKNVRFTAGRVLAKLAAGEKRLVPVFERLIKSDDADLRNNVLWELAHAKADLTDLVPLFLSVLDNEDWGTRESAGSALIAKASPQREVIEGLNRLVREDLVRVRTRSQFDRTAGGLLQALLREENNLDTVAPVLVDVASIMLTDTAMFSPELLPALIRLGPKAAGAVTALVSFLDSKYSDPGTNDEIIVLAIDALRSIGPAAHDAMPILKTWASHNRPQNIDRDWENIQRHALKALEKIKHDEGK